MYPATGGNSIHWHAREMVEAGVTAEPGVVIIAREDPPILFEARTETISA